MPNLIAQTRPLDRSWWLWAVAASVVFAAACAISPLALLALVVGAGLFAAVFLLPEIGVYLTVAAIPLEQLGSLLQREGGGVSGFTLAKVFGALTIGAWVARTVVFGEKIWFPKTWLLLCVFVLVAVFSLLDAYDTKAGIGALGRWGINLAFFLAIANILNSWKKVGWALSIFLIVTVVSGGYAVYQQLRPDVTVGAADTAQIKAGKSQGLMTDHYEVEVFGVEVKRSSGTTFHPIKQALNAILVIPIFIVAFFFAPSRALRLAAAGGLAVMMAALVASGSRGPLFALAVALAIMVAWKLIPINRFTILAGLIAVVVGWLLVPDELKTRLFSGEAWDFANSGSWQIRSELMLGGLAAVAEHPVNGIGIGNLTKIDDYLVVIDMEGLGTGPHSNYILIAMQTGLIGLAALLAFFYVALRDARRAERAWGAAGELWHAQICGALGICVWVVIIAGLTNDLMALSIKNVWFLIAVLAVTHRLAEAQVRRSG